MYRFDLVALRESLDDCGADVMKKVKADVGVGEQPVSQARER